jgi:hypothetical protein
MGSCRLQRQDPAHLSRRDSLTQMIQIEILSGWQEGLGGEDFLSELVQRTVQQVLEAEMTSFLGAESYQRNDVRLSRMNESLKIKPQDYAKVFFEPTRSNAHFDLHFLRQKPFSDNHETHQLNFKPA